MAPCILSLLLLLSTGLLHAQAKEFIKFCYFPNWAHQRVSPVSRYDVADIDPFLCTHLVYAFAAIRTDTLTIGPQYHDEDHRGGLTTGRYQQFNNIKKANKHLKTLLSIGGELAGSESFAAISKDDDSLQTFARTTVDFLRLQGFDGLDVDWEFPNVSTKAQFSDLLKTLRTTFEAEQSQQERLLLTVALPAGRHRIEDGFDIDVINRYVDLAGLMTYDYHGSWNTVTGFDSPLFSRTSELQFNPELSTEWTVTYYADRGLAANKILVGVTAAGTRFRLQYPNATGVGAPVIQSDRPRLSDLWLLPDRAAYPEICQVLHSADSQRVYDEEQQVPYVYRDLDWFGYEDVQSVDIKTAWMLKRGVAGAMFWSLDMDDVTGTLCDQGPYPLLHAMTRILDKADRSRSTHVTEVDEFPREGDSSAVSRSHGLWALSVVAVVVIRTFSS